MIALLLSIVLGVGGPGGSGAVPSADGQSRAELEQAELERAERAYRDGRYAEALSLFESALSEPGVPAGPVLYDLGNCAYRLGRHAEAVLYYRRALLRLPRDPTVEFNLRLTEQQLGVGARPGESALAAFIDSIPAGELLVLVGILQTVGLAGLVLLRGSRAARAGMALLVLLSIPGAVRLCREHWFEGPPDGVVLASEIALRAEPHPDFAVTLKLEAGELVRVEELSDRWLRVTHPRGGGFTERAGVGLVD